MPTKKTITTVEEAVPEDVEIIEVDERTEAAESALDGLLSEFSGADDVTVNVYRQGEGKNISFLFKTMPEDMTGGDIMERCRDQFGTGDYRIHVRKGRHIEANRSFSVEAPAKPEVPPQSQQFGPTELIAIMTKQNEQQQAMFAQTLTAIATMMSGAQQNQPQINPVEMQTSILQGVEMMKRLAEPQDKGPSGVEMLIKGLELARDMAPKTGETNIMDLASKLFENAPLLAKAAATQPVANPHRPMVPIRPQPGTPTGQPPQPGTPKGHTNPPMVVDGQQVNALKGQSPQTEPQKVEDTNPAPEQDKETEAFFMQAKANLQWLCMQAQRNANPELYAEVVLDQMGEATVLDFIGKDNAIKLLAEVEPTVGLYPGWFEALKNAILEMTSDETEPEGDPATDEPPDPATVMHRIDESGLRRKERQGATVNIPEISTVSDGDGAIVPIGSGSEPASDTERPAGRSSDT